MKRKPEPMTLLRTKLHLPALPSDHVRRAQLQDRLSKAQPLSTVLVSAPAGYGKTTLVASWLTECGRSCGWVSLDEGDNDLRQFLNLFVEAIRMAEPGAVGQTLTLLSAPSLPPMEEIATTLINEVESFDSDLTIVLDDIHFLRDRSTLDFLDFFLRNMPHPLLLVLVGRRDPVLSVAGLRARGMLTEIRMLDLRFSTEEALAFLAAATGEKIGETVVDELVKKTEGWVTGLRLAILALQGQEDADSRLLELKGTTRFVVDYLVGDVLDKQPPGIRGMLLTTSVLDRFCAPLCDALADLSPVARGERIDGRGFIEWLQKNNLFILEIDSENRWFRYHHLFAELLRSQLEQLVSPEEVAVLCLRGSAWCEEEGEIEEAIRLALLAGNPESAADIVERHRDVEFDENRWYVVDRWLEMLPPEVKENRPRLLLTEARVLNDRFRLEEIPPRVARAQALLESNPGTPVDHGELGYFQGFLHFWMGEGDAGQALLEKAHELLPDDHGGYVRAQLELFMGLTDSIRGRGDEGIARLEGWIRIRGLRTGLIWERLQFGLITIHILSGDLGAAYREGRVFLDDGRRTGKAFILAWADFLLGVIAFHKHDAEGVSRHFGRVIERKYAANTRAVVDAIAGLAINAQIDGRPEDVGPLLDQAREHARWAGDSVLLEVIHATEARVALLRGDLESAGRWQLGFDMAAQVPGMIFFMAHPCMIECRVLVARGTATSLDEAAGKLGDLRLAMEAVHYRNHLIEVFILQAMVVARQGKPGQALDLLQEVVELAVPRGWLRPFFEQGEPMANMLRELKGSGRSVDLVSSILSAFPSPPRHTVIVQPLIEPLSNRELDVLELLVGRLQNKEIAEKLAISPFTVKSHLRTVYQKLDVASRREAVEKAHQLGIIG